MFCDNWKFGILAWSFSSSPTLVKHSIAPQLLAKIDQWKAVVKANRNFDHKIWHDCFIICLKFVKAKVSLEHFARLSSKSRTLYLKIWNTTAKLQKQISHSFHSTGVLKRFLPRIFESSGKTSVMESPLLKENSIANVFQGVFQYNAKVYFRVNGKGCFVFKELCSILIVVL